MINYCNNSASRKSREKLYEWRGLNGYKLLHLRRNTMKIWQNEAAFTADHPISEKIFTESVLFFDIETTGFSPTNTQVYLIGCAARRCNFICVTQFFAEKPQEEKSVLTAFLKLANQYDSLISFNGIGFDIPYLKKRFELYKLNDTLPLSNLDIFHKISKFKPILRLSNMKQKSLEAFLGIARKDSYTGGELINIYQDYVKKPNADSASLLQMHNYDDLLGMPGLLPILAYPELFEGKFEIVSFEKNTYKTYENEQKLELILTFALDSPLPKRFSFGRQQIYLTGYDRQAKLKVSIYQGELKYFYSNYKDYYFLPEENRAIHKSVAFYVDKNFRTQAKAATCYSRKTGCFLPQYEEIVTPYFKLEYHDKVTWFEMTKDFTEAEDLQKKYACHLLQHLKEQART